MRLLLALFGPPHELLHALALLLIGRRPAGLTATHIDLPDDLTTGQYVFVAGMPAFVFGGAALIGVLGLVNAHTVGQAALALLAIIIFGLGAAGTMGDLQLIAARLAAGSKQP